MIRLMASLMVMFDYLSNMIINIWKINIIN